MGTTVHALLSASGSDRWLSCTPSARLEATLPEPKRAPGAFDYSAEGTTAHEYSEAKLRLNFGNITESEYKRVEDKVKTSHFYTEAFEQAVNDYVLYVRSQVGQNDRVMIEQRVDYSDWVPEGFGTADCVILNNDEVRVIDLKFGQGIVVDAKDNSQLRLYALGAYSKFKEEYPNIRKVSYTIVQPRLAHITTDGTTLEKLLEWAKYFVQQKAKKAWVGQGEFVPGDHCLWCRAKSQCKARADFLSDLAKLEFRDAALMSDEDIATAYREGTKLQTWLNDVYAYITNKSVESGQAPRGFKLTTTATQRKIKDIEKAITILKQYYKDDEIMEPAKLKSVAQLEKLGADKIIGVLGDLVYKPEGQPKLIMTEDTAENDFS